MSLTWWRISLPNKLSGRIKILALWAQMEHLWCLATHLVLLLWWRNMLLISTCSGVSRCQRLCQQPWKKSCLFLWTLSTSWEPGLTCCYFETFCQEMGIGEEVHCCDTEINLLSRGPVVRHLVALQMKSSAFFWGRENPIIRIIQQEEVHS